MSDAAAASRPRSEAELVARAAAFAEAQGYRAYVDPDGSSYFDLVVRRGPEVGLVEAKLGRARPLLLQALKRRAWGDWVAIVLPSRRLADPIVRSTADRRAASVGVWALDGPAIVELRPATPFPTHAADPFAPLRERFRRLLDGIDAGATPAGIPWDDVLGEVRRASGGRRFAEWRLDELA